MSFVVAIDGPAGSGKGTITKLVGQKEDLIKRFVSILNLSPLMRRKKRQINNFLLIILRKSYKERNV